MSFITPILITPSDTWAAAGPAAQASAAAAAEAASLNVVFIIVCLLEVNGTKPVVVRVAPSASDPEVLVQHAHFLGHIGGREARDDAAMLHDVELVGQRRGEAEVLLHHDDGEAALAQHADRLR